jgi:glycosyltransferase involved in cell wall biosynthesis
MTIESALTALRGLDGEVILADSASDDHTVDIAAKFPINVVSLVGAEDRSCGAAVQLGYQYSFGRYVCLIDGDMRLYEKFIYGGIRYLEDNADFAGVAGRIVEHEKKNLEYVRRVQSNMFTMKLA